MAMTIHHVQLAIPAGGEAEARPFYAEALVLVEVPEPPALVGRGGAWCRGDGLELHPGVGSNFRPARKAHPALAVDDIDGLASRLRAHGFEVEWDDLLPGYRRFYSFDAFGNRIEFLTTA